MYLNDFEKRIHSNELNHDPCRSALYINIYKAGLRMEELHPLLERTMQRYSIPLETFRTLYEKTREKKFGHLAGGIDRQGRDFVTMYYGVKFI